MTSLSQWGLVFRGALFCAAIAFFALPAGASGASLPSSPDSYVSQAERVRRANDRPWVPEAGRLGNLRHLQITASDCVVRVVSGSENRVFPGTRDLIVVERSRVLDADPDERPTPRDVVLAPDHAQACPGVGSCGLSVTTASRAPRVAGASPVCFTVQLATAHDLLLGGDRLTLLVDRLRQPALRVTLNPSAQLRVWFEQVDLGWLSVHANAAARVGGTGKVDFLQGSSSNSASWMYLHEFDASHVGVSTTTTGTQWSIRIGPQTEATYYQPARAAGRLAELYPIEIDGPLERLDVSSNRVDPRPVSEATRRAARALREEVVALAGAAPVLPASDPSLPSATAAAATLAQSPDERVASVVMKYLPPTVRITEVALWKRGGRLEATAPDAATAADIIRRLKRSGEFTYISGGAAPHDGVHEFSAQMHFSCDVPGQTSICPAGDRRRPTAYSEDQVIRQLQTMLGPDVTVRDVRLVDGTLTVEAEAADATQVRLAIERMGQPNGLFRVSTAGYDLEKNGEILATLEFVCPVPPKPDGICKPQAGR